MINSFNGLIIQSFQKKKKFIRLLLLIYQSMYLTYSVNFKLITRSILQVVKNYLILNVLEVIQTINTILSKGK